MNNYTDFIDLMANAGLSGADPIDDGLLHRFTVDTDKPRSGNGWYVLHGGSVPAGAFGSWKTGEQHTWCSKRKSELSEAEREEHRRRIEDARRQREEERRKLQEAAAKTANRLWNDAKQADAAHPYLIAKGIEAYRLRQLGDALLAPLLHRGQILNLQRIYPSGSKRFLYGGRVTGCYYALRGDSGKLYICEGIATAHTVHALKGVSVACALNAGNLLPVAKYFRCRYPDLDIVVAADNDHLTPGNPGRTKGFEAARAIDARITWPEFPEGDPGTDFNDLHRANVNKSFAKPKGTTA